MGCVANLKLPCEFTSLVPTEKHFLMITPTPQSFSKEQSQLAWQRAAGVSVSPSIPTTAYLLIQARPKTLQSPVPVLGEMPAGKGLNADNQWHQHANKGQGLWKWKQTPNCTILIQGHFQRVFSGDTAWSSRMSHCLCKADPTKRLGFLQTKTEMWLLFGVVFILYWEATQRENKHTFPWEKGKNKCHPPNTINNPNLSQRPGCSLGRQGVLTPKATAHNKHL